VDEWGGQPLHILIGNAGVMACPLTYTADRAGDADRHEPLRPLPPGRRPGRCAARRGAGKQGRAARLVSLSSIGHRRGGVDFDDPHYRHRPYDKWEAYGAAKTANAPSTPSASTPA